MARSPFASDLRLDLWVQEPLALLAPGACAADIWPPSHPRKLARLQNATDVQLLLPDDEGVGLVQVPSWCQALHLLLCLPAVRDDSVSEAWLGRRCVAPQGDLTLSQCPADWQPLVLMPLVQTSTWQVMTEPDLSKPASKGALYKQRYTIEYRGSRRACQTQVEQYKLHLRRCGDD